MANLTKCQLRNDEDGKTLTAYFNPSELTITKNVPWNKHQGSTGDNPTLEFTEAQPKELSLELLFDTYGATDGTAGKSVYSEYIEKLERFAMIRDPDAIGNPAKLRPPHIKFVWGSFPIFEGVIESLSVKYTMFFADGTPCRATASIKLKQAAKLELGQKGGPGSESGSLSTAEQANRPDQINPENPRAVRDQSAGDDGRIAAGTPTGSTRR